MAYSNAGQLLGTGDERQLFYNVMSQMVMLTYQNMTVMRNHISTIKQITGAKGHDFDLLAPSVARYRQKAVADLGDAQIHGRKNIPLDEIMTAATQVDLIDMVMNHYDQIPWYAKNFGMALARGSDWSCVIELIKGARSAALIPGDYAGTQIIDPNLDRTGNDATIAAAVLNFVRQANASMDEKNVPNTGRTVFVTPRQWYALLAEPANIVNVDYRGEGSIATGQLARYVGTTIVMANNHPYRTNVVAPTNPTDPITISTNRYHQVDASDTEIVFMQSDALGLLEALPPTFDQDWDLSLLANLIKEYQLQGVGFLRPPACVEGRIA